MLSFDKDGLSGVMLVHWGKGGLKGAKGVNWGYRQVESDGAK